MDSETDYPVFTIEALERGREMMERVSLTGATPAEKATMFEAHLTEALAWTTRIPDAKPGLRLTIERLEKMREVAHLYGLPASKMRALVHVTHKSDLFQDARRRGMKRIPKWIHFFQ